MRYSEVPTGAAHTRSWSRQSCSKGTQGAGRKTSVFSPSYSQIPEKRWCCSAV